MIDAHCHLSHPKFDADRHQVIERAKNHLVALFETGGNLEQNQHALELSMSHKKFIYAGVGLAPHYALEADAKKEFEFIERNADHIKAIGEIGLEYHYFAEEQARERQKIIFREQLILAEKIGVPVVIHCREAWDDLLLILKDFPLQKVMLHFFNKHSYLQESLRRGYYISIATLKSKDVDKIIRDAPLNSLLTETDSPYLWQGERNEPSNVRFVYDRISEIKKVPVEQVRQSVMATTSQFFEIVF
ncbi:TatD family hydrolase [Candidatus Micrarchaeota archaeon]|nr:TatD family hydrolase [Candidatus Micrarchaeota archaeon]